MPEKIVVTSVGILSALGLGWDAHLAALKARAHGLVHPKHLQTVHAHEFILGEVDMSNDSLSSKLGLPGGDNGYTRTTLLAMLAMQELLNDVGKELFQDQPFAFINANTVGGMCSVENMYADFLVPGKKGDFIKYIDTLDCAESTQNITRHFGIKPFTATISTACSSSANALILGARMIRHGMVNKAICGGCDALSRFTLNGFNSLKNVDREPCRPFDQNRNGLNLGEGAGYLLLEKESDALARGANILAVLEGYCNSNDAYHPTAPAPDGSGAYRTMKGALEMASLTADQIGYINAHGTATTNNDAAEGKAIENLFADRIPMYSSTKPYTGHTLAAAGAIEAIFSIMGMKEQMIFPNLNFDTPMEELISSPVCVLQQGVDVQHAMSNSFGFGGNNVSLVFGRS